jgi:hypothetical protein
MVWKFSYWTGRLVCMFQFGKFLNSQTYGCCVTFKLKRSSHNTLTLAQLCLANIATKISTGFAMLGSHDRYIYESLIGQWH